MDPVTHITAGLAVGQTARGDAHPDSGLPPQRWLLLFGVLAAWIPDIDNFSSLLGPEAYMRLHRGITHSFLGGAITALILAIPFAVWQRRVPYIRLAVIAAVGIATHLWLDVITSYGTQLAFPFSDVRCAMPGVFIIDPFFTLSLLAVVILSFVMPSRRKLFGVFALAWLLMYPLTNMAVRDAVARGVAQRLADEPTLEVRHQVVVMPDALAPLYWKAVILTPDTVRLRGVNLLDAAHPTYELEYRRPDPALLAELGRESSFMQTWNWFSEYPLIWSETSPAQTAEPGGRSLTLADARYVAGQPLLARFMNGGQAPVFSVEVDLDPDGQLSRITYHQRGKQIVYGVAQ